MKELKNLEAIRERETEIFQQLAVSELFNQLNK